ncbi:MAG: hypothetical protein WDO56_12800 [Gammaproteobacteria bacterium]
MRAARTASEQFGNLMLDAWRIGKDLEDPDRSFTRAFGISSGGATLIRPDGFVAWRSPDGIQGDSSLPDALQRSLAGQSI